MLVPGEGVLPGGHGLATVGLVPDGVPAPVADVLVEGEVDAPVPGEGVVAPVPAADGVVVLVVPAVPDDVDGHGLLSGRVMVVPGVVVDGVTVVPGVTVPGVVLELPVLCPGMVVVIEPTPPDGTAGGMPPDGTPDGFWLGVVDGDVVCDGVVVVPGALVCPVGFAVPVPGEAVPLWVPVPELLPVPLEPVLLPPACATANAVASRNAETVKKILRIKKILPLASVKIRQRVRCWNRFMQWDARCCLWDGISSSYCDRNHWQFCCCCLQCAGTHRCNFSGASVFVNQSTQKAFTWETLWTY